MRRNGAIILIRNHCDAQFRMIAIKVQVFIVVTTKMTNPVINPRIESEFKEIY